MPAVMHAGWTGAPSRVYVFILQPAVEPRDFVVPAGVNSGSTQLFSMRYRRLKHLSKEARSFFVRATLPWRTLHILNIELMFSLCN